MNTDETLFIQRMQAWTEQFIVALNICPFAKREVQQQRIRYTQIAQLDDNLLYDTLLSEMKLLDTSPEVETTLILLPTLDNNFPGFLSTASYAQHIINLEGYTGVYQVANFHPLYVFSGSDESDAANYTNRSPHSALHILRESSLERAIRAHKNAEQIPEDNIEQLRQLGLENVKQRFARLFE